MVHRVRDTNACAVHDKYFLDQNAIEKQTNLQVYQTGMHRTPPPNPTKKKKKKRGAFTRRLTRTAGKEQ